MRRLVLLLILAASFGAVGNTSADSAIVTAAKSYTTAHSGVKDFHVTVEKIGNDYARVKIAPSHGQTDAAWLFLKKENGRLDRAHFGDRFRAGRLPTPSYPRSLQR